MKMNRSPSPMRFQLTSITLLILAQAACHSPKRHSHMTAAPTTTAEADQAIAAVLDSFHDAAATADGERYFAHFADGAVFLGTDATERWSVGEFREFATPYFEGDSAWIYTPFERHIDIAPGGRVAWFDEKLTSASYGETRGSGALVCERGTWRISQYVLSFPVPNDVAKGIVELIQQDAENRE
jgi:hypothetical protein